MRHDLKFGVRKRTASRRRLVLRLVMLDLSDGLFSKLPDSLESSDEETKVTLSTAFQLPLDEERQETTAGANLDPASIRSLRSMFLLLDEWECALEKKVKQNSFEECEIAIDTKPN